MACLWNFRKNFKFTQTGWRLRPAITFERAIDDAIAVKKNGVV
jgi:hypothetical protein